MTPAQLTPGLRARHDWLAAVDRVAVVGLGIVEATATEVAAVRANPRPPIGGEPPNLRHADEQTVLAVAAVFQAASATLGPFDDWGVIASPNYPGRFAGETVKNRFDAVGVRGVGPQVIPNLCLHAAAATVSMALAARGPVFGVGGGPAHVADGLLAGLTFQLARGTARTWLVLTEWDGTLTDGVGRGVALGLAPVPTTSARWTLGLRGGRRTATVPEPTRLSGLVEFLTRSPAARWDCPLPGGCELSLAAEADA